MKKSGLILLFLITFVFPNAHAFKGSRCSKLFTPPSYIGKNERTFAFLFYLSTSTSQFFTSTGACRMLGGISEKERTFFVAENSQHIKKDLVRAEGDYLAAVSFLYGCDNKSYEGVAMRLQENVTEILGPNLEYGPDRISQEIDRFMSSDSKMRQLCSSTNV